MYPPPCRLKSAKKASGAAPHSLSALEFNFVQRNARVAKLADARDLKSRVPHGTCGFDSRPGHQDFSSLPLSEPRLFLFVQPQAIVAVAVKPVVVLASHVSTARTDMSLLVGLHHAELKAVHAVRTPSREISGQSNCGGTHRLPLSWIEVFPLCRGVACECSSMQRVAESLRNKMQRQHAECGKSRGSRAACQRERNFTGVARASRGETAQLAG